MAESRPASTHSWRNTLLSTWRAAGERPKLTFDTPSVVYAPGSSALMRRIASMVAMRVAAEVVVAGRQREGQGVEDEVARLEAVAVGGEVVDAVGDPHLPLDVAGLALLVDEQADDRRAVLAGELEDAVEPRALVLAVLEVRRVEDGPAAEPLQPGLHDLRLGRVHDERRPRSGWRTRLATSSMSSGAVAADVVDADVEDVGALLDLVLGHLDDRGVPVAVEHRLAELLRAVGVGALADDQERGGRGRALLVERRERVERRDAVLVLGRARRRREVLDRASASWRMYSGVVPQQPPTTLTPKSSMKRRRGTRRTPRRRGRSASCRRRPRADRRWAAPRSACARAGRGSGGARPSRSARWRS